MKQWSSTQKPPLEICPEHYCFHWIPPNGTADLSGKVYNSFVEAIEASNKGTFFLEGGCSSAFGLCKRATQNSADKDWYEPMNWWLKKSNLPELFFCNPQNLVEEDKEEYERMALELWGSNT